jgi:hypothetical protein
VQVSDYYLRGVGAGSEGALTIEYTSRKQVGNHFLRGQVWEGDRFGGGTVYAGGWVGGWSELKEA